MTHNVLGGTLSLYTTVLKIFILASQKGIELMTKHELMWKTAVRLKEVQRKDLLGGIGT